MMKPVMSLAAAMACGFAFAEGIASANIVGYQNQKTVGGDLYTFAAPTFNVVGGNDMTLGDIKLNYEGNDAQPQSLWTLTATCSPDKQYWYVNETAAAWEEVAVGWYSDEDCTKPANDVKLPYGSGVAVVSGNSNVTIGYSGQVSPVDVNINTVGGDLYYFTGNCMPTDYTLGDIALIYSGHDSQPQSLWTMTATCSPEKQYWYVNEAAAAWDEVAVGWYEDEDCTKPANDVKLAAGKGFAVVSKDVIQVRIPTPLSK